MEFGYCKICRDYRMLIHENACVQHAEIPDVNVQIEITKGYSNPKTLHGFTSTITEDPRLIHQKETDSEEIVYIKLSDMEIIIEDEHKDPIEKFEYDDPNNIPNKAQDSVNWIVENY